MNFQTPSMMYPVIGKESTRRVRGIVILFIALTVAMLFSPLSRLLLYLFPLMATVTAILVFQRSKTAFTSLICWLWMLTPLVRRIVDYRAGWIPATAILVAPLLATAVPAVSFVTHWRSAVDRRLTPLLFVLAGVLYGLAIGLVLHNEAILIAGGLLYWLCPLCFAFFLYQNRDIAGELKQSLERSFVQGLLVISAYGLYQFFYLPKWDAFWMENVNLVTIGTPERLQFRAFGTLNSPQTFGAFLVVGLLYAFRSKSRLRVFAIPLGLMALAFTGARSAWLGFGLSLIYLFFYLPRRQKFQLAVLGLLTVGLLATSMQVPGVNDLLMQRVSSLSDPSHDSSVTARTQGYQVFTSTMLENPFGQGLGANETEDTDAHIEKKRAGLGQGDSAVIGAFIFFGIFGAFAYLLGLLMALASIITRPADTERDMLALKAILIALAAESLVTGVFQGPAGFLTWSSVGLGLALLVNPDEQPQDSRALALADPFAGTASMLD